MWNRGDKVRLDEVRLEFVVRSKYISNSLVKLVKLVYVSYASLCSVVATVGRVENIYVNIPRYYFVMTLHPEPF